jgi:hypothetical protein
MYTEVIKLLKEIESNQTNSLTKSRYVTDGFFAMYVILLPAPNGGAVVMLADCNMDQWTDEMAEYSPETLQVQAYRTYKEAEEVYWSWDL